MEGVSTRLYLINHPSCVKVTQYVYFTRMNLHKETARLLQFKDQKLEFIYIHTSHSYTLCWVFLRKQVFGSEYLTDRWYQGSTTCGNESHFYENRKSLLVKFPATGLKVYAEKGVNVEMINWLKCLFMPHCCFLLVLKEDKGKKAHFHTDKHV